MSKRFVTALEVRDMGNSGVREIVVADDIVITDAARELAIDLGIRVVSRAGASARTTPLPVERAPTAPTDSAAGIVTGTSAERKAPPLPDPPTGGKSAAQNERIVDAIIDAFRAAGHVAPSEPEVRAVATRVLVEHGRAAR